MASGVMMPLHTAPDTIHERTDKPGFIKIKNCSVKGESQEYKKTSLGLGQNICTPPKKKKNIYIYMCVCVCVFNKELLSKVYKELLKFNKKANNLILR